jgi:hypothetical protein
MRVISAVPYGWEADRNPAIARPGEVLGALEQKPAGMFQNRLIAFGLELFDLLGADRVDRLAHMAHDMEAIEDVNGLLGLLGDERALLAKPAKKAQESLDPSRFATQSRRFRCSSMWETNVK